MGNPHPVFLFLISYDCKEEAGGEKGSVMPTFDRNIDELKDKGHAKDFGTGETCNREHTATVAECDSFYPR